MTHREAPELGAACVRMFRALARRAGEGELEALEQLSFLQDSLSMQLGAAVAGYREFPGGGYSWTDVGRILGITRQAAQQRFGACTVGPAWPASSCCCEPGRCNPLICNHCAGIDDPELCPRWVMVS